MSQIRERSKNFWRADNEEGGRCVSSAPPAEPASALQNKKNQKKKREKNSWKNGGFGAVNPKCHGRFLKVTQLSGRLGRGRKIEEIPFFRDRVSSNPAEGNKRSFKLSPASATKIFGSSMIPQSPNKIVKASERARSVLVEVKKNGPIALAPLSLIQYSIPQQASADGLAPQQRPRTVIPVAEPLSTPVLSLPVPQRQQPEKTVPVQSVPELPPLIKAVINLDYQLLERLPRDLPIAIVNAQDAEGRTVLHHAVLRRNLGAIKKLLKSDKVDFSAQDSEGNTALILAARDTGLSEMTQILLAFTGSNACLRNKLGQSAISIINQKRNKGMLRIESLIIKFFEKSVTKNGVESQEICSQLTVLKQMMSGYDTENSTSSFRKPSGHEIDMISPCNYNHCR